MYSSFQYSRTHTGDSRPISTFTRTANRGPARRNHLKMVWASVLCRGCPLLCVRIKRGSKGASGRVASNSDECDRHNVHDGTTGPVTCVPDRVAKAISAVNSTVRFVKTFNHLFKPTSELVGKYHLPPPAVCTWHKASTTRPHRPARR